MKLEVVFPQTEIGPDPAVVRDYAQAAESASQAASDGASLKKRTARTI